MNKMLEKLVNQGFMSEEFGEHIEKAMERKESFIVSGHKGWGILPLLASLGATAKTLGSLKQVKSEEDLEVDNDFLLVGDLKNVNYEDIVTKAFSKDNKAVIALKDPDHPYSINKVLKTIAKSGGDINKTYNVLECAKIDGESKLPKITIMNVNEKGKISKEDI